MCWCRTRTGLCPGHQNLQDQSQRETLVSKWFSLQPPKQHWPEPRSQSKWVSPISHGSQSTARSLMTYFALLKDNAGAHSRPKLPKWSNTLLEALYSLSYTDCMTRCCISSTVILVVVVDIAGPHRVSSWGLLGLFFFFFNVCFT